MSNEDEDENEDGTSPTLWHQVRASSPAPYSTYPHVGTAPCQLQGGCVSPTQLKGGFTQPSNFRAAVDVVRTPAPTWVRD